MANKKTFCECCGASLMTHKHSISKSLVVGLIRLYKAGGECNIKELGLTRNQWDNFQKLKYWGLVQQVNVDGKQKTGVWKVTPKGLSFLAGREFIPKTLRTFRGAVVPSEPTKSISIKGFDDLDVLYRKRDDYVADMAPL